MENVILYFFSTIPQILAAIIALVFIFVLYKLQSSEKIIDALCNEFELILGNNVTLGFSWQRLGSSVKFMRNHKAKNFNCISKIMLSIFEEHISEKDNKSVFKLKSIASKTSMIENKNSKIIKKTKLLCLIGFITIISSLVVIPFTKEIDGNRFLMNSLFIIFILSTIYILKIVYDIMTNSLNFEEFQE